MLPTAVLILAARLMAAILPGSAWGAIDSRGCGAQWARMGDEDKDENQLTVEKGFRLVSSDRAGAGDKIWVITEADCSFTTLPLPEY